MFTTLTLRGTTASIVWGYRTAVELRSWDAKKNQDGTWTLRGRLARVDSFQSKQKPLLFTAPRGDRGFWTWPVQTLTLGPQSLVATLGPPEH